VLSKRGVLALAMRQIALDLSCAAEDFTKEANILVIPQKLPGQRPLIAGTFFFRMATFGQGAVIAADEKIHGFLREYMEGKTGHWLFEEPHQRNIDAELAKHGKCLWHTSHFFLPDMHIKPMEAPFSVRWFERADMASLYQDDRFHNALSYSLQAKRPDMLAVASYENGEITGMAGASADCEALWQIGIDVLEEHRGKGLGTVLVTLLKNELLRRGQIPYYGTTQSNLYSQNIAVNCGFYPAWVEAYSTEDIEA